MGNTACCYCAGPDEQLRVEYRTEVRVHNGPHMKVLAPFSYKGARVDKALTLGDLDYVRVRNKMDGSELVARGPQQLFLEAYGEVVEKGLGVSLTATEYVLVTDHLSGEHTVVKGPCMWFPEAAQRGAKHEAVSLSSTEYLLIQDKVTGTERVQKGPLVWFPGPEETAKKHSGIVLSSTDYVEVEDTNTGKRRVEKGPCIWFPEPAEKGKKGEGISLSSTEYVLVEDGLSGERSLVRGPCVWIPGPHEQGKKGSAISLSACDYIVVEDQLTGKQGLVRGPCVWFPRPYDSPSGVKQAIPLQDDEYVKLKDLETGEKWVQRGKALLFLEPTWRVDTRGPTDLRKVVEDRARCSTVSSGDRVSEPLLGSVTQPRQQHLDSGVRTALVLTAHEFVRLLDKSTGKVTTHRGEATVFPSAEEELLDGDKMEAIDLKVNEYVKIMDQESGEIRVVAGSAQVFLGPHDKVLDDGKKKAVQVDEEHAALVRNKATGQLRLVTERQLFVPGPEESIEEVRELIKLADHEAMIIKDKDGVFSYYYGSEKKRADGQPRSFFLPPYAEVVTLNWSRGPRREKRDLYIQVFDCRAQYMCFEFSCRTKDNVELVLEGTFFWEVVDLPLMVSSTGDTSGDICSHARSQFIRHVAQVTLREFMEGLNEISNVVYQDDKQFYTSRGVQVHSLEVTGYKCADQGTSEVLKQIIQETTNRMNRLSQAESENEVKLFRMQGEIEQGKLNGQLLQIQHQHAQEEARITGMGEADCAAAFISGLAEQVPELEQRVEMWHTLRKRDALAAISEGGANFYYTPNDVNLSIQSKAKTVD